MSLLFLMLTAFSQSYTALDIRVVIPSFCRMQMAENKISLICNVRGSMNITAERPVLSEHEDCRDPKSSITFNSQIRWENLYICEDTSLLTFTIL